MMRIRVVVRAKTQKAQMTKFNFFMSTYTGTTTVGLLELSSQRRFVIKVLAVLP